uniref:(northern house mosquito) hypothetical protein n=1 Tax=Culex pipiens TaxID=7175 RepID=A0A8D8GZP4_CULPI
MFSGRPNNRNGSHPQTIPHSAHQTEKDPTRHQRRQIQGTNQGSRRRSQTRVLPPADRRGKGGRSQRPGILLNQCGTSLGHEHPLPEPTWPTGNGAKKHDRLAVPAVGDQQLFRRDGRVAPAGGNNAGKECWEEGKEAGGQAEQFAGGDVQARAVPGNGGVFRELQKRYGAADYGDFGRADRSIEYVFTIGANES